MEQETKNDQVYNSLKELFEIVTAFRGDRIPIKDRQINASIQRAKEALDNFPMDNTK